MKYRPSGLFTRSNEVFVVKSCNPFMHVAEKWPNILWKFCCANTTRFLMYVLPFLNFIHRGLKCRSSSQISENFLIWFLKFLYCWKDNSKSCSDLLYETHALNLISCTQEFINGKNLEKTNNCTAYTIIQKLYNYMCKNLMERYFALKISFLIFRRPKNSVLKVS